MKDYFNESKPNSNHASDKSLSVDSIIIVENIDKVFEKVLSPIPSNPVLSNYKCASVDVNQNNQILKQYMTVPTKIENQSKIQTKYLTQKKDRLDKTVESEKTNDEVVQIRPFSTDSRNEASINSDHTQKVIVYEPKKNDKKKV